MQKIKRKWLTILLIVFILTVSMTIVFVVNKQEDNSGFDSYKHTLALSYHLNIAYYRDGSSYQVELSPTDRTEEFLERWQAITEVYPFLSYPEEAIARNDWREVIAAYDGIRKQYKSKMGEEEFREANPSFGIIMSYIETGSYISMDEDLKDKLGLDR
ncbi:hypothetical protein [Salipaludibacillus agaradhaerens]|uniref:hypothetical protein n=1 Tax=Salipaludibacillus agaradhaerens TaxID=76935 RepID=UPI000996A806|nr:hypothetical protein [Salipaludibacillus agaradhaerens]